MYPRSGFRSGGTRERTLVPGEHPNVPSFRFRSGGTSTKSTLLETTLLGSSKKGGFSKGSFCRVQCHAEGNKKYSRDIGPSSTFGTQSATAKRGVYVLQKPFLKKPCLHYWFTGFYDLQSPTLVFWLTGLYNFPYTYFLILVSTLPIAQACTTLSTLASICLVDRVIRFSVYLLPYTSFYIAYCTGLHCLQHTSFLSAWLTGFNNLPCTRFCTVSGLHIASSTSLCCLLYTSLPETDSKEPSFLVKCRSMCLAVSVCHPEQRLLPIHPDFAHLTAIRKKTMCS